MDHWSSVPPEEAKKYFFLRIYALLDPNNPRATLQFLDPLRSHLSSAELELLVVNQALGMALWATSYQSALRDGLASAAHGVQQALDADPGVCGTHIRGGMTGSLEESFEKISSNHLLAAVYWDNATLTFSRVLKAVSRAFSRQCRLMEIERPLPFISLVQCKFFALVESLTILFGGTPKTVLARKTLSSKFCCMRAVALDNWVERLENLAGDNRYRTALDRELDIMAGQQGANGLMAIYDALEARDILDPAQAATILSTLCDEDDFDRHIASFATLALAPALPGLVNSNRAQLRVKLVHQDKQSPTDALCTVEEFQKNYLQSYIQAHAKRVASHQLAAAELVEADIQDAIAEVWKSMPGEFRGTKGQGSRHVETN
ncbi:hypothetical protein FRC06_011861 [Ceratobasidium sp. 370]|nr:hypothetical protein FRC06_011861 [Ceratobasidium sp. 370]